MTWAGSSDEHPGNPLDAAIIFAPVGTWCRALAAVRKGGRVVCGGIHMSDIPAMPYALLWQERELVSVANLTRARRRGVLSDRPPSGGAYPHPGLSARRGQRGARRPSRRPPQRRCRSGPLMTRSGWRPDQAPAPPRRRICSNRPLRFMSFPPATIPNTASRTGAMPTKFKMLRRIPANPWLRNHSR